jgi:hypothetical protein
MKYQRMSKKHLLVAETFSYSYANYADHLGINPRFDEYMPNDIDVIEKIINANKGAKGISNGIRCGRISCTTNIKFICNSKRYCACRNCCSLFQERSEGIDIAQFSVWSKV